MLFKEDNHETVHTVQTRSVRRIGRHQVVLLIFAAGVVVAQEGYDPEKDIDHNGQIDVVDIQEVAESWDTGGSPRGALHVFASSVAVTGSGPAAYGRSGMHSICRADDPAAHFCNAQEIENAWKTTGVDFVATGQVWVDNAIVGTVNPDYGGDTAAASDWFGGGGGTGDYPYNCNAWTVNTNAGRGLILNSGAISLAAEACDDTHAVACCK
ncbi:MAG: hypothetical protein R2844_06455 [Caldilineales bacterium]